jgi:hypothetical protein
MTDRYYIETSIPSFYYDNRLDVRAQAMKQWTRTWWDSHKYNAKLFIGPPVLSELSEASDQKRDRCLQLISELPVLSYNEAVDEIVSAYISRKLMPNEAMGDAAHLALASFHKCDFLITWNCRHIANANKFDHIRRVNGILGLFTPKLVTPLQLLEDDYGNS